MKTGLTLLLRTTQNNVNAECIKYVRKCLPTAKRNQLKLFKNLSTLLFCQNNSKQEEKIHHRSYLRDLLNGLPYSIELKKKSHVVGSNYFYRSPKFEKDLESVFDGNVLFTGSIQHRNLLTYYIVTS